MLGLPPARSMPSLLVRPKINSVRTIKACDALNILRSAFAHPRAPCIALSIGCCLLERDVLDTTICCQHVGTTFTCGTVLDILHHSMAIHMQETECNIFFLYVGLNRNAVRKGP